MPGNGKSKRKSERKAIFTRSKKSKKIENVIENGLETFEDGCDVVSSILEENCKPDDKIDDEIVSIASDTLLCLEEVYCDASSTQQSMSPWGSEINAVSLVIGEGVEAEILRDKIQQLTSCHDVQLCGKDDSFELCNTKGFVLVWLIMTVPVGPEILSLTTSIRYASKFNRGTVIIGVANAISTVDLRLHGIDEIVIQPVDGDAIRHKYSKWTSVTIVPGDLICCENEEKDIHCKTENPTTPLSPASTLSADTSSCSALNNLVDNNGMGQLSLSQLAGMNVYKCIGTSVGQPNGKQKYQSASDHTTKEKVRRERIKDSCDQLRVLLPYIRGRKTDMASILEMCVDYLKLVNAALPQDFQNQIVEILAKDSSIPDSPLPNEKRSKSRKPDADSTTVSSTVDTDFNNNEIGTTSSGMSSNKHPLKDNNDPLVCAKPTKRFRIQPDGFLSAPSPCITNPISVVPFDHTKGPIPEPSGIDQQQSVYNLSGGHPTLYNEFDIQNLSRPFNSHDTYSNTYYGSPLASNKNMHDRDNFGLYLDPQSFYQFYGSNTMCAYGLGPVPDYVNPNAILPVSYNACKKTHVATPYEEQNNIASSQQQGRTSKETNPNTE